MGARDFETDNFLRLKTKSNLKTSKVARCNSFLNS
jgi:hypothetical protein